MRAMRTGTANFHSNRSAMYAEMTSSEAMIAMIALFATVWPNVGPTDCEEKLRVAPNAFSSDARTDWTFVGCSVLVEICTTLGPRSLPVTRWIFASP